MMMMETEYKVLDEFPTYRIYSNGKIFSLKKNVFIEGCKDKRGYTSFTLYNKNGKRKYKSLHQLLALSFIPNPNGYDIVRHLDDDKSNNALSNLKWGTVSDNVQDAIRNGVYIIPDNSKKWLIKTPDGNEVVVDNLTQYCKMNNLTKQNLHKTYTGERSHHKNFCIVKML